MGFPRQEYWSRLTFPFPGDLLDPRIKPTTLAGRQALYHWSDVTLFINYYWVGQKVCWSFSPSVILWKNHNEHFGQLNIINNAIRIPQLKWIVLIVYLRFLKNVIGKETFEQILNIECIPYVLKIKQTNSWCKHLFLSLEPFYISIWFSFYLSSGTNVHSKCWIF